MSADPTSSNARAITRGATVCVDDVEDVAPPPPELFTTLSRTSLFLEALQRDCLGTHALGFPEYSVLRLLQAAPRKRLPPKILAERIVRTTGAITKLVDRLERAKLVERSPDPDDRRGVLVCITGAGSRLANRAGRTYNERRESVLSHLTESEIHQAKVGLERLLAALEADRGNR